MRRRTVEDVKWQLARLISAAKLQISADRNGGGWRLQTMDGQPSSVTTVADRCICRLARRVLGGVPNSETRLSRRQKIMRSNHVSRTVLVWQSVTVLAGLVATLGVVAGDWYTVVVCVILAGMATARWTEAENDNG